MKQLIVRKNHHERVIICCPLCFWNTLSDNLSWLFMSAFCAYFPFVTCQGTLGNPVFRPQHMPLPGLFRLWLQQFPFVGTWKVRRTVCIYLNHHLIYVELTVALWIRNPDVLTTLTFMELSGSSELRNLPRWMQKEIRRRARHIRFASTSLAYERVHMHSVVDMDFTESSLLSIDHLISKAEITSINRCLLWKGGAALARNITAKSIISQNSLLKNMEYLSNMHPMCLEMAVMVYGVDHWLSSPVIYMLTALEQQYPCFFYTKVGSRMLSILYAGVGILHILQGTGVEFLCLGRQVSYYWQGITTPMSLMQVGAKKGTGHIYELPGSFDAILGSSDDNLTPDLPEPTAEASNMEDIRNTESAIEPTKEDTCSCGRRHKTSTCAPKMKGLSSSQKAIGGPETDTNEASYEAFQKMLAASYVKVTGVKRAPLIVPNAAALDNSKKSGKYRLINCYKGNTPALSIEAMMEVFEVMYPGYYITDFKKATKKGEKDTIYLHTNCVDIACPHCGKANSKVKDGNVRTVQDISLRNGVGLELKVTVGRAYCENPDCANHGVCYNEPCSFAGRYMHCSHRVHYLALVTGTSSSFHDTERQMKLLGISFGDDCASASLKSLQFRDEKDVTIIGIDDVSIRKGQSYCTIIYNMANGHMLKLIEGRSGYEFQKQLHSWLEQHPNVVVVLRDRASAYGSYIDRFCHKHKERNIVQVADRFHLLQNLSDNLRKHYYNEVPYRITLNVKDKKAPVILDVVPNLIIKPVGKKPEGMDTWQYNNDTPVDSVGNPILFDVNVDRMPEKTKIEKEKRNNAEYEKIMRVRKDYEDCGGKFAYGEKKKFLEKHSITNYYFDKYISMTPEELEELLAPWKPAPKAKLFDNYKNLAYKMLKDDHSIMDVYCYTNLKYIPNLRLITLYSKCLKGRLGWDFFSENGELRKRASRQVKPQ